MMATATVRQFIRQAYRLINPSNPTVPLHGDDESFALLILNQLLEYYASNGLMLTIARTETIPIDVGIFEVWVTPTNYPINTFQYETVTLTSGYPSFNVANGSIYAVGDGVSGNGIPPNTFIASIVSNTITMTNNATIYGTSALTFSQPYTIPGVTLLRKGRLANLDSAWLLLNGVTYPLIYESRDDFLASWKYDPLVGLPRFIISFPDTDVVKLRLYPAPSQFFNLYIRAKFQLDDLTANDDMSSLPQYYQRYLLFALAKDIALYKGRADAWTDKLEQILMEAKQTMEGASEVNLSITGDKESLLNGAWRTRAGI